MKNFWKIFFSTKFLLWQGGCSLSGQKIFFNIETFSKHQYILKRHLAVHTGERKFSCDGCEKSFKQFSTLSQHKVSKHSDKKPYVCEICRQCFCRASILIKHRKIHNSEKPFKCSFCDKRFHQKINLNVHENIHTDKRPYKCTRCQKGFNQKSNLNSHQQSCLNRRLQPSEQLVGDTKFKLGQSPAEMQISRDVSHNTIVNSSKSVDISTKSSFTNNF